MDAIDEAGLGDLRQEVETYGNFVGTDRAISGILALLAHRKVKEKEGE